MRVGKTAPRVIVVDDEPQVLAAIADALEDQFHVLAEVSPLSAIKILEREKDLSVIISDQRMPGLNGHEFLSKAREISDATRILITGYSDLDAVIAAVNAGRIFSYIAKPWDPVKLRVLTQQAAEHCELVRALTEEQRLLNSLLDNVPDEIYFKDRDHRFLRSNRAFAASLGLFDPTEAIGRTARDLLPPNDADALEAADSKVFTFGQTVSDTTRRTSEGERTIWLSTARAPIRNDNGQITGLVAIARDVSDSKENEQKLRNSLAEKDLLLGEIHHRVMNNLQIVHGLLDLEADQIDNPVALELLRNGQNRIRSMAHIHQTLYDSGNFSEVDFASFLDNLLLTLFASYGVDPSRIAFSVHAADVQLPIKTAIPCGLLVNELITNALKHAFPDGRAGEIRIDLTTDEGEQVRVSVSDNGVGIPADLNLEQSRTRGMHLVNLLADQLGATKTVERAQPTRFVLHFSSNR